MRLPGAHCDVLGLCFLRLGYQDLQYAILRRGLYLVGLDMAGQGDRAAEGAVAALNPVGLLPSA